MSHVDLITPPHSIEAEQSVLGGLLLDNSAWDRVGDLLHADDFYRVEHRSIYTAIGSLVNANKVADIITVHAALESLGRIDEIGGLQYLNALAQSVPSASNARGYGTIVRERSLLRKLYRIGSELATNALHRRGTETAEVPKLIDGAVTSLMALTHGSTGNEPCGIDELVVRFIDDLSERAEGRTDAIATGLVDLDRLAGGGGRPGELWVIGARPSMGKTAIVLTLSRNVGAQHPVLMLTQEDSLMALTARHVAAAGRVNLADIRNPQRAPDSMWNGVTEGVDALSRLMIDMDDQAGLTLMEVRRKVQQVRRKRGRCALAIVDYLQLMEGDGDNRNQELGKIANGLKKAAKDLGCWIVLLSQLNRKADERPSGPEMQDLRDSGDIEGAADVIGLLHRDAQRNKTDANKHHAELRIVKHKNGSTDTLNLHFDGATQRFENWDGPAPRRERSRGARSGGGGLD